MLRWIVILLAGGRVCFTGWLILVSLAARAGLDSGLGFDADTMQQMADIPALPFLASILYTLGYLATALLVVLRRKLALYTAILAAALDIGFWAINAANPVIAQLSADLDWGAIGVRDMVLNIAAILMVAGVLRLSHRGQLH